MGSNIFDYFLTPLTLTFGDWLYAIVWGTILIILQLRVRNTMMTGLVGSVIAFYVIASNASVVISQAMMIGFTLLALSIGFILYQGYKNKLENP